eukprot:TRINITY_DN67898_c2_g1_i2.p2 TRINITY_DN67898_c2_g1~~TRINITY_DN67898_c2_g1_i2.p2  ORF type:complete len:533 (-),score=42.17 TRINITY_DN67898_c2_g1_i2:1730-3208(-)
MKSMLLLLLFSCISCVHGFQSSPQHWRLVDPGRCVGTHCTFEILSPCYSYDDAIPRCFSHQRAELLVEWSNNHGSWRKAPGGPHVWNRGDGSFAFRMATAHQGAQSVVYNLTVTVYPDGEMNKESSPGIVLRLLEKEICTVLCDNAVALDEFKERSQCTPHLRPHLLHDFSKNLPKITTEMIDKFQTMHEHNHPSRIPCVLHVTIINNKVYFKRVGNLDYCDAWVGREGISDAQRQLLLLSRAVKLPDVEFLFHVADFPVAGKHQGAEGDQLAIVSWCSEPSTRDVVVPSFAMSLYLEAMAVEDIQGMDMAATSAGGPWSQKTEKAFFRGRDTSWERVTLMQQSIEHPEDIDAGITYWQYHPDSSEREQFGVVDGVEMPASTKYKYLLNVDGFVAAYRFGTLLASGSVVFKQESKYYEWFYTELSPWEHYIPVAHDLHDLREKIEWARNNDDEARRIGRNARLYARYKLRPQDLMCYWADLYSTKNGFQTQT